MTSSPLTWIIAGLALLFTVASFLWIHLKPAKISSVPVTLFIGSVSPNGFNLTFPVMFFNNGALPAVIRDVRLTYRCNKNVTHELVPLFVHETFASDKNRAKFHPYSISGRNVVTKHIHFGEEGEAGINPGEPTMFRLEILQNGDENWRLIRRIKLDTAAIQQYSSTYRNDRRRWSAEALAEGIRYQNLVIRRRY